MVTPLTSLAAIGFDLGDTLCEYAGVPLNWEREYAAALSSVAEACGCDLTAERKQSGKQHLLRYNTRVTPRPEEREYAAQHIFEELLRQWRLPGAHLDRAIAAFFRHFRKALRAFPESARVLRALQSRGVAIGVLTDVPYGMPRELVVADLQESGLPLVEAQLLTSSVVGHRKPHPAGFRALAARLGVACPELMYVGNERKDVDGGNAAGCRTVLLWRARGEAPAWGQEHTIQSLDQLLGLPTLHWSPRSTSG